MRAVHRRCAFGFLIAAVAVAVAGCTPAPETKRFRRANELFQQKKYVQARREIDAAIEARPGELSVYITAMGLYQAAKRYSDMAEVGELLAERSSRLGLKKKLTPDEMAALFAQIGRAYWDAKALDAAESAYKKALKLAPGNATLMNDLGYFYAEQGIELEQALKLTRAAARLEPDSGIVLDSLGWVLYKLKRYDTAVKILRDAVELSPNEAELRYHLGAALAKAGRGTDAQIELGKALVLDSSVVEARILHATLRN